MTSPYLIHVLLLSSSCFLLTWIGNHQVYGETELTINISEVKLKRASSNPSVILRLFTGAKTENGAKRDVKEFILLEKEEVTFRYRNPLIIPFHTWKEYNESEAEVFIQYYNNTLATNSASLLFPLPKEITAESHKNSYRRQLPSDPHSRRLTITYSAMLKCKEDYIGPQCELHCSKEDSTLKHYICDHELGKKRCPLGIDCEVDGCNNKMCPDGSHCESSGVNGHCVCAGSNCAPANNPIPDNDVSIHDPCSSPVTCQNGGTCVPDTLSTFGFHCKCPWEYRGPHCEMRTSLCGQHVCRHGDCTEMHQAHNITQYHCRCHPGFIGESCDLHVTDCTSNNPCQNNEQCVETKIGESWFHRCICPTGLYCKTEHPCSRKNNGDACGIEERGLCRPNSKERGSYEGNTFCECRSGWQGDDCGTDVNECQLLGEYACLHGGTCENQMGGYQCHCGTNFTGSRCEFVVEGETRNLQLKGHEQFPTEHPCSRKNNGEACGIEERGLCRPNPKHHSADHPKERGPYEGNTFCECRSGWQGDDCGTDVNECQLLGGYACLHGGTCENQMGGYQCHCGTNITGSRCELLVKGETLNLQLKDHERSSGTWQLVLPWIFVVLLLSCLLVAMLRMKKTKEIRKCLIFSKPRGRVSQTKCSLILNDDIHLNYKLEPGQLL